MNYNANTLIDRLLYANNRSLFSDINQSQKKYHQHKPYEYIR